MTDTLIDSPTPEEIHAHIRAAEEARALAIRGWVLSAAHWIAHPHFGHRTA